MSHQVRIVSVPLKLVFIVVGYAAVVAANTLIFRQLPIEVLGDALGAALEFCLFYLGSRVFRGRGEDRHSVRPLWRMTAAPRAGFVIAACLLVGVVYAVVTGVTATDHPFASWFSAIEWTVLALLYARSSFRLRSMSAGVVEEASRPHSED